MPIPTGGAWPPPHLVPAYDAYAEWDAWYVGDPDQLRIVYERRGALNDPPARRNRASQYAGGVVGRLSRWMWGTPAPTATRDARLHIPLPADLARTVADLLFSEPPQLSATNPAVQARLDEIIEEGLNVTLRHGSEASSALGDMYLRPVIDEQVFGRKAKLIATHADAAIPVFRWGHLVEITFWQCLSSADGVYFRLLEHHDVVDSQGRITYALFKGNQNDLGRRVPYADHPAAEASIPNGLDEEGSQLTGLRRLDVVHFPNAGPQRRWRTKSSLKYLGRSDFDGNETTFDALDETWTSWMRDLRLAKGRITVPEYMLQSQGSGAGAVWDPDREVYSALMMLPQQQGVGSGLTATQFQIRHAEHKATADAWTEVAMRHTGLSAQTMGEQGGDVAMTATESQARERMSFTTRGDRTQVQEIRIADAVELQLELERIRFGGPEAERPHVEFGDSVTESPEAVARTAQLLAAASAASTETLVRMVHPGWDDEQVADEVRLIQEGKQAIELEDPGTFTGNDPEPDDQDELDTEDPEAQPPA